MVAFVGLGLTGVWVSLIPLMKAERGDSSTIGGWAGPWLEYTLFLVRRTGVSSLTPPQRRSTRVE